MMRSKVVLAGVLGALLTLTPALEALAASPYDPGPPYRCRAVPVVLGRLVLRNRGPIVSGFGSQCVKRKHGAWEARHLVLNNHTARWLDVVFRAEVRKNGRWVAESRAKGRARLRPHAQSVWASGGAQRPTGNRIRYKIIKITPR